MAAPGYGGPGWLWDCGYGGPWLWQAITARQMANYNYIKLFMTDDTTDRQTTQALTALLAASAEVL